MNQSHQVLPNLAALKNYTSPSASNPASPIVTVQTLGYTEIGDNGGLLWYYDAKDTISMEEYPFVVIGQNDQRWKPVKLDYITPEMFGASGMTDPLNRNCDKVDDRTAIQQAINAAKSPWTGSDNFNRHASVQRNDCQYTNQIILKLHGAYYIGGPLLIDENIILDARLTLYLLEKSDPHEKWNHILEITKQVEIFGSISVNAEGKAKNLLIGRHLGNSTLPDFYVNGFTGYAIEILSDQGAVDSDRNNNHVNIGMINGKNCGRCGTFEFTKTEIDKNLNSHSEFSRLSILDNSHSRKCHDRMGDWIHPNTTFRFPEDIEFVHYAVNDTVHKVVRVVDENTIEVHPKLGNSCPLSGTLTYISGGVLHLTGTAGIWNIKGISAVLCPGTIFRSNTLYGATLHYLHIDGGVGAGVIFGDHQLKSVVDDKIKLKPIQTNANLVLNPYFEGTSSTLKIPFLLCGGSQATIIEPWDNVPKKKFYRRLGFSEGNYSIIRNGEAVGSYARIGLNSGDIAYSNKKYYLTKNTTSPTITEIKLHPYLSESEIEIYVFNYVAGKLHFTIHSSANNFLDYTINGIDLSQNNHLYELSIPPSGNAFIKIMIVEQQRDFKIICLESKV